MSKSTLLTQLIKDNKAGKDISPHEEMIAENLDTLARNEQFYSLPSKNILNAVKKCTEIKPETVIQLASHMVQNQVELLQALPSISEASSSEMVNLLASFSQIPLLASVKEKFSIVETDYQYYYEEEKKKNQELENVIKINNATIGIFLQFQKAFEESQSKMPINLLQSFSQLLSNMPTNEASAKLLYEKLKSAYQQAERESQPATFDESMSELEKILQVLEEQSDSLSQEEIERYIQRAEYLRDRLRGNLKDEKSQIVRTARENGIDLRSIGLDSSDDDD